MATSLVALLLSGGLVRAQSPPDPDYVRQPLFESYDAFKTELLTVVNTADPAERQAALDAFWTTLKSAGQVPYAQGNRYAFLYRGSASSVGWRGDFNGWNNAPGTRYPGTDLWIREGTLPADARVDYKIFADNNWLLDPANPLEMWSGFGPNSELRMPEYEYPVETIRRADAARGALAAPQSINSAALGYRVQYRVYSPAGYESQNLANLPVVYVTDGHEYAADHMGSLVAVLDNLIDEGALRPALAVFIDPRNPSNASENRRIAEYNMNPAFASFVTDELVPAIDDAWRTHPAAAERVILGTSMGGLNSAYFGAVEGDVFQKIAIQSPAFSFNPAIYDLYRQGDPQDVEIYMTAGTINDGNGGPTMAAILEDGGYVYTYVEAHEGHSWGNWRGQLADLLIALVGPPTQLTGDYNQDGIVNAADYVVWRNHSGTQFNLPNRDPDQSGPINQADFESWRASFGTRLGGALGSQALTIPEPSGIVLIVAAHLGLQLLLAGRRAG